MISGTVLALLVAVQAQELRLVEDHRIGAVDAPEPEVFGQIADLAVDRDGRLFVLDAQAGEVRVFDGKGSFLDRIGRTGQGPGEFGRPLSVDVRRDTVFVHDAVDRLSLFSTAGGLLTTESVPRGSRRSAFVAEGFVLALKGGSISRRRLQADAALVSYRNGSSDTLRTVPSASLFFRSPAGVAALRSPLCGNIHFQYSADGTLYVADGVSGLLEARVWEGDAWRKDRTVRIAPEAEPLSDSRRSDLLELVPEWLRPEEGELITTPVASSICGLEAEEDGSLWVQSDSEGDPSWFSLDGESLEVKGRLNSPDGVELLAFGAGRATGVWKDALGVNYVVTYEIIR